MFQMNYFAYREVFIVLNVCIFYLIDFLNMISAWTFATIKDLSLLLNNLSYFVVAVDTYQIKYQNSSLIFISAWNYCLHSCAHCLYMLFQSIYIAILVVRNTWFLMKTVPFSYAIYIVHLITNSCQISRTKTVITFLLFIRFE